MFDQPTIETTIYDYIEINGRISKKLFQKIVEHKLNQLTKTQALLDEAVELLNRGKTIENTLQAEKWSIDRDNFLQKIEGEIGDKNEN